MLEIRPDTLALDFELSRKNNIYQDKDVFVLILLI